MIEDASVAIQEVFFFFFAENQLMVLFCLEIDYGWERFFLLHTNCCKCTDKCVQLCRHSWAVRVFCRKVGWISYNFFFFFFEIEPQIVNDYKLWQNDSTMYLRSGLDVYQKPLQVHFCNFFFFWFYSPVWHHHLWSLIPSNSVQYDKDLVKFAYLMQPSFTLAWTRDMMELTSKANFL